MLIIKPKEIITVKVEYYIPDYSHLLNEFICQYEDLWPEIPRIHQFLNYWKNHIEATIRSVYVTHSSKSNWRAVDVII